MPKYKRHSTKYPGVYYIIGTSINKNKAEKIYYILYRKKGKRIEEKAGKQYQDNMTPAKASHVRIKKINSEIPTNNEERSNANPDVKWTLNALWLKYSEVNNKLKRIKDQEYQYNKHLKKSLGHMQPQEISANEIDMLQSNLSKTYQPQTVAHILNQLKRLVNFGVNRNLCTHLNFKIKMPKFDNQKTEDLTTVQLQKLLKAFDDYHDIQVSNFMRLALVTGMRKAEILKLRWKDVDFNNGFIHIKDPKGGIDEKIPLNNPAREILNHHPRLFKSIYIFPSPRGGMRTRKAFSRQINEIKKLAQLPDDFRPLHGLRHVYASMLASSGKVDMYTLQKLLTHKSPAMTQRYAHLRDETLKSASNLMEDLVNQAINTDKESKEFDHNLHS
ncbi:tyrosine-type recombinase/integrase [Candidatus Latescibacterota bacterium]